MQPLQQGQRSPRLANIDLTIEGVYRLEVCSVSVTIRRTPMDGEVKRAGWIADG
jgi:hypothetical protein